MKNQMLVTGAGAVATGAVAHFTHSFIERKFANGWKQMVAHTIGVSITAPFFYLFCRAVGVGNFAGATIEEQAKQERLLMLCFFAAFFCVGIGTLIGWVLEPEEKPDVAQ